MALDHFLKHNLAREKGDWNFNVLFNDQPHVAHYAAQYANALDHKGLHGPVPGAWLHATILRVGFVDDFTEDEMLEVATRLEPELAAMQMPEFLLGQWWIWDGNPCVHITPEYALKALFETVVDQLSAVVGATPQPPTFIPHVSLAYSRTYDDEVGLFKSLETTRIDAVPIRVKRVSLVKQRAQESHYTWDIVRETPVGQNEE